MSNNSQGSFNDFHQRFNEHSLSLLSSSEKLGIANDMNIPENYTINFFFNMNPAVKERYEDLSRFGYLMSPFESLHVTIVGMIPIDTNVDEIIKAIRETFLDKNYSFYTKGHGLSANLDSLSFLHTPDFDILKIRKVFQSKFNTKSYSDEFNSIAWSNFLFHNKAVGNTYKDFLQSHMLDNFGRTKVSKLSLLKNSRRDLKGSEEIFSIKF